MIENNFLDVRVHLRGGYLIPEIHSKPTDSHEYLNLWKLKVLVNTSDDHEQKGKIWCGWDW